MEKIKKFLFQNTSTKQTIIKNTFWLFLGEFGVRILKLIIFVYATRKMGVSEWGLFSYALALMAFFNIISDIGINSVLLKETVKDNEEKNNYISTGFFLKLGLSVISSLLLISTIFFIKENTILRGLVPITALLLLLDTMREFGFYLNRAFEKMETEAITRLGSTIILVMLGYLFIEHTPKASSLIYAYVISSALGIFIIYINLRKHFKNLFLNFNNKLLLPIWKEAWPVGINITLGTIMASLDIIILGWFRESSQVGFYSTAQKLFQFISLLPLLFSTALLPVFSRSAQTDIQVMRKMASKTIIISIILSIFIIVSCFIFGESLILVLFGSQYIESVLIFKIMSLSIITLAPSSIIGNALFAEGKQKKLILYITISLIVNMFLCLITIPKFGIMGASISVTIAQIIGNILLIFAYYKIIKTKI